MSAQSLVDLRDGRRSHRQPPNYRRAPSCRRLTCARGCDARSATPAWGRSRAGNRSPPPPSWSGTVEQKPTETRRCETWFDYRGKQRQGERTAAALWGVVARGVVRACDDVVGSGSSRKNVARREEHARPLESSPPNHAEQAKTVEDHQQARAHVSEDGHPHRGAAEHRQDEEHGLDAERQTDVLPENRIGAPGQADNVRKSATVCLISRPSVGRLHRKQRPLPSGRFALWPVIHSLPAIRAFGRGCPLTVRTNAKRTTLRAISYERGQASQRRSSSQFILFVLGK
jgi:hypothetical protein